MPYECVLPGNQKVPVLEEESLCDGIFVPLQPVQTTLVDYVPHYHICILNNGDTTIILQTRHIVKA